MPHSPFATDVANGLHNGVRVRQIDELVDIMSPKEIPFLKLVGIDGEAGHNPKFEWLEDTLLAETAPITTGTGSIIGSASNTKIYFSAANEINFQKGMVVKVNDELMYITSDCNTTDHYFTVVRGVAGTSASAAHADTNTCEVISLANAENADAPRKSTTEFVNPYNFFQAFDTSYKISYIAANTELHGVPAGDDARELEKAFSEVSVKLERAAINSLRADYDANNAVPRLMGGLAHFLPTSGGLNYAADLNAAHVTEKDLNDMFQDRFQTVGQANMAHTLLVAAWNKRKINDIFAPFVRTERTERTGGVIVDTLDTDWGPMDVVLSLRCPTNKIFNLNLDFIKIHPFKGLAFFDQELAVSGAYTIRQIYGVYSMKVKNPKCMGVIFDTSTSA